MSLAEAGGEEALGFGGRRAPSARATAAELPHPCRASLTDGVRYGARKAPVTCNSRRNRSLKVCVSESVT